jgi:hypothetical protein
MLILEGQTSTIGAHIVQCGHLGTVIVLFPGTLLLLWQLQRSYDENLETIGKETLAAGDVLIVAPAVHRFTRKPAYGGLSAFITSCSLSDWQGAGRSINGISQKRRADAFQAPLKPALRVRRSARDSKGHFSNLIMTMQRRRLFFSATAQNLLLPDPPSEASASILHCASGGT